MNRTERILVVDDDEEVRQALLEVLQWLGPYQVEAVVGGEEALAAFDEARHALLITDHCMPGMLGAELIQVLRQRAPWLSVVALTGAGEDAERELLSAGADKVLRKPFDIGQIREAVGRALKME